MNEQNYLTCEKALATLKKFQVWRLGGGDECPVTPQEITGALYVAIDLLQAEAVMYYLITNKVFIRKAK